MDSKKNKIIKNLILLCLVFLILKFMVGNNYDNFKIGVFSIIFLLSNSLINYVTNKNKSLKSNVVGYQNSDNYLDLDNNIEKMTNLSDVLNEAKKDTPKNDGVKWLCKTVNEDKSVTMDVYDSQVVCNSKCKSSSCDPFNNLDTIKTEKKNGCS